jgi:hypothetical protein
MLIGFADLFATAILHQRGLIVELNPAMRPFIEKSEWLFVAVKGATLFGAWWVMAKYAQVNLDFVRKSCLAASICYLAVWVAWFSSAR